MIRHGRKQTNWQPHGYQGFGFFIHGLWSGSPPDTRGRSPVRKSRTPGSVRGYPVTGIPTATIYLQRRQDELQHHHPRQENHRRFPSGRALRDHTVKQGFEQLMMWVENHRCPPANGWPSTTITRRKCRRKNCAARQRSPWTRIMSFPPTAKG